MAQYIDRIVDAELEDDLSIFGAVALRGPKWCGKTTTGRKFSQSEISMTDPANDFAGRLMATTDPATALVGKTPRLVDEWQEVPKLWDAIRYECDRREKPGQFVLAGSTTPNDSETPMHSGAGRFAILRMDTMTLFEMGRSTGEVSLSRLFAGETFRGALGSMAGLPSVAEAVCRGGWPSAVNFPTRMAMRVASEYVNTVAESDVSRIDGVRRDPAKIRALLTSLARNESTLAGIKAISADMDGQLARNAVSQYLSVLARVYVIDDVPAWNPALRSPVRLRSSAKRHLADPSLAVAALGANESSLVRDPKTLGLLFESLAIHDLKVYARPMGAAVYHYHDAADLEVDAIVAKRNGDWAAFEVKMGPSGIAEGVKNILALEKKMVAHGERPPVAKCVLVAYGAPAHVTEAGVQIVPIDALAP
ncbi:ATP-binding protein [Rubneribacter sp.]